MIQQIELFDIASPCFSVCTSNKEGYCLGYLHSRTERQLWLSMANERSREVLKLIVGRKQRVEQVR